MTPQVIRGARWKSLGLLAICLVFCAIALWLPERSGLMWATLIFSGLGAVIAILRILQPATLTLDDRGFDDHGLFGRGFRVEWSHIEAGRAKTARDRYRGAFPR